MLELASFVHAQKTGEHLRILPVLLDLCIGDLKDIPRWSEHWKNWVRQDNHLDHEVINKWEIAVRSLKSLNMLMQSSYDGEVALRKEIVQVVQSMMPPDIQADITHVQGKKRLYEETVSKFSNIPTSCSNLCENAGVLGVYGIVGIGKSTLCMILTNFLRREFKGRVCHVEFNERDSTVKLQRKALKQLTGASQDFLNMYINTMREGLTCLKERMPRQEVFMALDNVSDIAESKESASMFLEPKFHLGSKVLVTSCSKDVLQTLGIPESCCMLCPHVTDKEALKIVLNYNNVHQTLTKEQRHFLHQTLPLCKFEGLCHPMSLKLLASQMGRNPSSWRLGDINLQEASDKEDPLFSAIETIFSRLPDQQTRDIFMDIALFCPENVNTVHDICTWLSDTLHPNCDINRIKNKLRTLRLKSLLEVWSMDADIVRIHDLHRELAKRKARVEEISYGNPPRFVYQKGDKVTSAVLSTRQQAKHIERAGFVECSFTTVSFEKCSRLQLICIRSCEKLATLPLHRLQSLVSLELSSCQVKCLELQGLDNLRWLCVNACGGLIELDASDLVNLTHVWVSRCINLEALKVANSNMLKSLSVSYNSSLEDVDLGSGQSLQCLTLWFCEVLTYVQLSGSEHLSEFRKRGCPRLLNIRGCINVSRDVKCVLLTRWHNISSGVITSLEGSNHLRVLDLWDCPASRLPDLRGCSNLHELRLSELDVLLDSDDNSLLGEYDAILCASSESLQLPVALQDLRIASCRNVVVKEVCWKLQGLKNLEVLSMQQVRVAWDWELYMPTEQKGSNASFQAFGSDSFLESLNEVLPTDAGINREAEMYSEEAERLSCEEASGATIMDFEIFNCLHQIMYWVKEYLEHSANNSHLEREIKNTIQLYWEKNIAKPLMAVSEDRERMTINSDRIRKLQYGIIEQTLLETCSSCDTACKQVFQRLSVEYLRQSVLPKANTLLNMLRRVAAQELNEQLHVVRAISPRSILMHDDLETWEKEIINELTVYERVRSFGKDDFMLRVNILTRNKTGILRTPRIKTLKERLHTFATCREGGFRIETVGTIRQWRWDWLRSCKICALIEQLFLVERQTKGIVDEDGGSSWNFQWLGEMVKEIDLLLQSELDKSWSDVSLDSLALDSCQLRGMLRGWKTLQWLQALASDLSQDLFQECRVVTDEGLPSINEECKEIIKARYAKLLYPYSDPVARVKWTFMEGVNNTFAIAEALALKMQEKQQMMELLHPNENLTWEEMKNRWKFVERKAVDLQERSLCLQLKAKEWDSIHPAIPGLEAEGNKFLTALLDLSVITDEEMTQKERVSMLDCIEVLSSSVNIVSHGFNLGDEEEKLHPCLGPKAERWKVLSENHRHRVDEETFSSWLKPSENLAKMLKEQLELWKTTYCCLEFGGESKELVLMWDRASELASQLAHVLGLIDGIYCHSTQKTAEMVERKMKDIWQWAGGMSFQHRFKYIMNIEQEVMQLYASAVPEIRQNLLSMIIKQGEDTSVAPGESAFLKLIQHFQFMEQVHWEFFVLPSTVDEAAQVKLLMMERVGKMRALMMQYEPSQQILKVDERWSGQQPSQQILTVDERWSDQQPLILNDDKLQMWIRAAKSPLRKTWNNINRDQNFSLPISNCPMLCHLHISNCKLRIPPYAQERGCIPKKLEQQQHIQSMPGTPTKRN